MTSLMGAPKKDTAMRMKRVFQFRVTDDEKAALDRKARAENFMSTSAWIRKISLDAAKKGH